MPAIIEAVTLDWYGTLATHRHEGRGRLFSEYLASHGLQSAPWDRRVLYEVFDYYSRVYRPQSSEPEKQTFWTEFTKQLFELARVEGSSANQYDVHASAIRDMFGTGSFQVYPDVQPVLQGLQRLGLRLAVISNWHGGLDSFCYELNLSGLFETVIASADVGIEKPAAGIFHEAVRRLGVEPARIVHVGDSPGDDFAGAVAAGFRAVLIDRLNQYPTHPNRMNSLFELEPSIRQLT